MTNEPATVSAMESLKRLREGNARFTDNVRSLGSMLSFVHRSEAANVPQQPHAIILGCSDSRVPAEIVFDQGLGELFVIRVAGNVVAPSQVGSIEFAASRFGTQLVVVMGHTGCGAIRATIESLQSHASAGSSSLRSIVDRVRPAVESLLRTDLCHDPVALDREATRANVRQSCNLLRHSSEILERLILTDRLLIVGAEYSLETGRVSFFDGVPEGL